MNSASFAATFRWRPACCLQVTGLDAATFLQGQFTNDLRDLARSPRYGLWLNVKGKVVADSFVIADKSDAAFWILSYACPAAVIQQRLESFVIADDVTINDQSSQWAGVSVFGDEAEQCVAEACRAGGPSFVFPGRRTTEPHVEWVVPTAAVAEAVARVGSAVELSDNEVRRRRIEAGIPLVPTDIGPGDLPNEGGLDADAISYSKGCYLGQEVMARLKSMGQVRRRLLRVTGRMTTMPACPAPLFAGGRPVGELRSVAPTVQGGVVGLAMLTLMHLKPATPLAFDAAGEPQLELAGSL